MGKVLIVVFSNISKDPRVLRHIDALCVEHEILTVGFGPAPRASHRHIEIPAGMSYLPTRPDIALAVITRRFESAVARIPAIKFLMQVIVEVQPDLVFTNDAMPLAVIQRDSINYHADLHEYAPREMEDDWRFRLLLQRLYAHLCTTRLPLCRSVTTVSEGLAREYSREFGVSVATIRNIRHYASTPTLWQNHGAPWKLVHTGLASKARKIENLIKAVSKSSIISLDLYLVAAPRQARYLRRLKRMARKTGNVRCITPVDMEMIPTAIARYDAGLLVINPGNFSLRHCLPNKLFDCMVAGRGVIVGPSPDLADFVSAQGVGDTTPDFSPRAITAAIEGLTEERLLKWSQNAIETATKITADIEGRELRRVIQRSMTSRLV